VGNKPPHTIRVSLKLKFFKQNVHFLQPFFIGINAIVTKNKL